MVTPPFTVSLRRASSTGRSAGGESLQLRLSLEFEFTSNSPEGPRRLSCQISANQRDTETGANIKKQEKTCQR